MAGNTEVKKSKGLKNHKKAQKAMVADKRAVAAAAAKSKKTSKVELKVEPAVSKETIVTNVAQENFQTVVEDTFPAELTGDLSGAREVTMVEQQTSVYNSMVLLHSQTNIIDYKAQDLASEEIVLSINSIPDTYINMNPDLTIVQESNSAEHVSTALIALADEVFDSKAHCKAPRAKHSEQTSELSG
jgi:hypothetical protein